jgi:hypothetical protein
MTTVPIFCSLRQDAMAGRGQPRPYKDEESPHFAFPLQLKCL